MISNKNVFYNGLLTFWKKPRYPSFIPSLQPIITWLLKLFGNKIKILKWGKKLFQNGTASTTFYFKVGQALFQKGAGTVYFKVGQLFQVAQNVISKCGTYFKVGRNTKFKLLIKETLFIHCITRILAH